MHKKISDDEMEAMYDFCVAQGSTTVRELSEFSGRVKSSLRNRLMVDQRFTIAQKGKGAHVKVYPVARAPQVDEAQPTASTQPADDVPVDVPLQYHLQMFAIIPAFIRRDDDRIYISSLRMTSLG